MSLELIMFGPYNPDACCGADCFKWKEGNLNHCAGDVEVVDEIWTEEDYWWIHACQVHIKDWDG